MKILIVIPILLFLLVGCGNKDNNTQENNSNTSNPDVNISRTSTEGNNSSNNNSTSKDESKEVELYSFSTTILIKDSARTHNISITCSILNGTEVKPGETFSFTETVGKATPERGYEKADIYDSNGNVVKGYGGGNCQISSTLYNAVLNTSGLTVIERHAHSKKVTYVPERKRCCG